MRTTPKILLARRGHSGELYGEMIESSHGNRRLKDVNVWIGLGLLLLAALQPALRAEERASPLTVQGMKFPEAAAVSPRIRKMLDEAIDLTERDLRYLYGVADPERGFDCSGFVFHLLLEMGAPSVPRQANTLYEYLCEKGAFQSARKPAQLGGLEPGDLLFWTGTYDIDRKVTHVMIYLGLDKKTGQRWMVGAAGRNYGVGVFPFSPGSRNGIGRNFIGFGKVSAFFTLSEPPPKIHPPAAVAALEPKAPNPAGVKHEDTPPYQASRAENTYFENRGVRQSWN